MNHPGKFAVPVILLLAGMAIAKETQRVPVLGACEGCEAVFDGIPQVLASRARIAPVGEPGEPMLLRGRVLDQDGDPRPGVIVYAYQTSQAGTYPASVSPVGNAAARHGRLRAWAVADAAGRYAFDTVRPGSYPGGDIPQHIHMHVIEPGCFTYYIDDVMFLDDPKLTPGKRAQLAPGRGGNGLVTPRMAAGTWRVERDIVLGLGVPGHRACRGK